MGHIDNHVRSNEEKSTFSCGSERVNGGDRPSSYSAASGIPGVDHWAPRTLRKEEAQVGGEVGGSEVVGGPPPPPPTGKSCGTAPTDTCKHADSPPSRTHGARESFAEIAADPEGS